MLVRMLVAALAMVVLVAALRVRMLLCMVVRAAAAIVLVRLCATVRWLGWFKV